NGALQRFLVDYKFKDPNTPRSTWSFHLFSEQRIYPIHVAAKLGDYQLVRILLAAGADRDSQTSKGRKAEDFALEANTSGSHDHVLSLLKGGAKVVKARALYEYLG
ncbi:unnamed protein product, partial [Effrenium voratum]